MRKILFIFAMGFALSGTAVASETTHLLGTTTYMIREANFAGAEKKDPENYNRALALQKQAKQAFRGTGKYRRKFRRSGRNLDEAQKLSYEAYLAAKAARDNSDPERYSGSKDLYYKSIGR